MGNYGGKRKHGGPKGSAGRHDGIWELVGETTLCEEEKLMVSGSVLRVPAIMINYLKAYNKLPDWAKSYSGMTFRNENTGERVFFTDDQMRFL